MSTFTVGQEVWLFERRYRGNVDRKRATIAKVGRKYVTLADDGYQPRQFRIDTGWEKSEYNSRSYIRTDEQQAEHDRIDAARKRLADYGVKLAEVRGYGEPRLTAAQWEAIADAIEATA